MKQEELKTVYLKDVEELAKTAESFQTVREIIQAIKNFIAKHRSSTDSEFIAEAEKEIATLSKQRGEFEASSSL